MRDYAVQKNHTFEEFELDFLRRLELRRATDKLTELKKKYSKTLQKLQAANESEKEARELLIHQIEYVKNMRNG